MSYEIVKALHIVSFISWMAGMLYLPRLFVYHAGVEATSEMSETFKVMEHKLLRLIMTPAMIATWIFGIWLIVITGYGAPGTGGWIHVKIVLALILSGMHGMMAKYRKDFERNENTKSARYFKWFNEIPTIVMVAIVFLAVLKPF